MEINPDENVKNFTQSSMGACSNHFHESIIVMAVVSSALLRGDKVKHHTPNRTSVESIEFVLASFIRRVSDYLEEGRKNSRVPA
jgi:hypothetical protein